MTLKHLGREAGLSHPFLSQLERGLARPSVTTVERIARALDVPVSTLWTTSRQAPARVVRAPHAENGAARGIRDVMAGGSALRVREWTGGSKSWPDEGDRTTGEVMVYVVRGAVEIDLEGEVHALREGDSLFFDGMVRHRLRRRGGKRTRALYVATG
jgi:transcriptional regulator with XRE-family HTH domain